MTNTETIVEFLIQVAPEAQETPAYVYNEWFHGDEFSFHAWTMMFAGWQLGKGLNIIEMTEEDIDAAGVLLGEGHVH